MLRKLSILLTVLLAGCAHSQIQSWSPYTPPAEIGSETDYERDLKTCRFYAQEYIQTQSLDPYQIAQEGSTGALSDVPYLPISPLSPALGGASGASGEALDELGITARSAKKVFAWCMHDKGLKDGFYSWDPNL